MCNERANVQSQHDSVLPFCEVILVAKKVAVHSARVVRYMLVTVAFLLTRFFDTMSVQKTKILVSHLIFWLQVAMRDSKP